MGLGIFQIILFYFLDPVFAVRRSGFSLHHAFTSVFFCTFTSTSKWSNARGHSFGKPSMLSEYLMLTALNGVCMCLSANI